METRSPTNSFLHSQDYCSYNQENPGHRMEEFVKDPIKYGMSCNNKKRCQKKTCKELRQKFDCPIIYCASKICQKRSCLHLNSLSEKEIELSMCYEKALGDVCLECIDEKKTRKRLEENNKKNKSYSIDKTLEKEKIKY